MAIYGESERPFTGKRLNNYYKIKSKKGRILNPSLFTLY